MESDPDKTGSRAAESTAEASTPRKSFLRLPSKSETFVAPAHGFIPVLSGSDSMRGHSVTMDLPEPSVTSPTTNARIPADSAASMAAFAASGRTNQTMPTPMLKTR